MFSLKKFSNYFYKKLLANFVALLICGVAFFPISKAFLNIINAQGTVPVTVTIGSPTPIITFTANDYAIVAGEQITLTWTSSYLTSLSIDQGIGPVDLNGSVNVSPPADITYTISGTGPHGDFTSSLFIDVESAPPGDDGGGDDGGEDGGGDDGGTIVDELKITIKNKEFNVKLGTKVTIEWETTGEPEKVFCDYLKSNVPPIGSFSFLAKTDVDITITATKGTEEVSDKALVRITEDSGQIGGEDDEDKSEIVKRIEDVVETVTENIVPISTITPLILGTTAIAGTQLTAGTATVAANLASGNNIFGFFVAYFVRKKRKFWGLVYDSTSKKPVSLAIIRLIDPKSNKVLSNSISNLDGQYGFITDTEGNFVLEIGAEGYETFKEKITVDKGQEVIKDIALVATNDKLGLFQRIKKAYYSEDFQRNLNRVTLILMFIGVAFTLFAFIVSASFVNLIILIAYILLILVNIRNLIQNNKITVGAVLDERTREKVAGAGIRMYHEDRQIQVAITNNLGLIKMNISPGEYLTIVTKSGYRIFKKSIKINRQGFLEDDIYLEPDSSETEKSRRKGFTQLTNPFA